MRIIGKSSFGSKKPGLNILQLTSPFDPLTLDPYLFFDVATSGGVLKTGGTQAAFLDLVPTLKNLATGDNAGSDATQGTSGSQPLFLPHTPGANYLFTPGVASNSAIVPHAANLCIPNDIAIEWEGVLPDYSASAYHGLVCKWSGDFFFGLNGGDILLLLNGSGSAQLVHGLTNGQYYKLRVIRSGDTATFYKDSGSGFVVIGSSASFSGATTSDNLPVQINNDNSNNITRGKCHRVRVWDTATPESSVPVLDVDFASVSDGATSFVCATGQTVTVNSTGNNPAQIIGRSQVRFDGVDDGMDAVFDQDLTTGIMFAVLTMLGNGSDGARIFSTLAASGGIDYINPESALWAYSQGTSQKIYYASSPYCSHSVTPGAILFREVRFLGSSGVVSWLNNGDQRTDSVDASDLLSSTFRMACGASTFAAVALQHVSMFPANLSADDVAKIRVYLNDRYNLGLTLP